MKKDKDKIQNDDKEVKEVKEKSPKKKKSLEDILKSTSKSTLKKIPPAAAPWFWSDRAQTGY